MRPTAQAYRQVVRDGVAIGANLTTDPGRPGLHRQPNTASGAEGVA